MRIVADTNIFLAVALEEPEKSRIIEFTCDADLLAPEVLPFEIGNALTSLKKKKIITLDEMPLVWNAVQQIPVELLPIDIKEALVIAGKYNIYAYDAYFLLSALSFQCPLLTLDRRMKEIARSLNIKVLE